MPKKLSLTRFSILLMAAGMAASSANAQQSRITAEINEGQRLTLTGHVHPKARPENDLGRVSPSMELSYVTVELAPSASQQADLQTLLAQQQDPASPNYHRWLTPEQYAERFGASADDVNAIASWLQGHGLSIAATARGRNWIAVNGTAVQVEGAFQTEIHSYLVNGENHFANSTEPSVPNALGGVVKAIRGLHDFRMKPAYRAPHSPTGEAVKPDYTTGRGTHYLAPDDFATIYDISPLYTSGINGAGQSLVVAGQTAINLSDIETFHTTYNLPGQNPQQILVPGSKNPGISSSDLSEADLDLEWSSAVARNANIIYVYSSDVMTSVQYAIDNDLAPVMSVSYGSCELETPSSDASTFRSWAQYGNSMGITWLNASGDTGAADCDDAQNPGLSVDTPASVPEVTAVGGTEFQEGSGTYWSATNTSNAGSALSFIPETTWNDSAANAGPDAGGGGSSIYFTKPSWQTGPGVPLDNARDVPDVALAASNYHDGYLVYTAGSLQVFGGTSCPTPSFAGLISLLSQYLVSSGAQASSGVGNINPKLYSLAQTTSGIFHDVTTGNNIVTVPCPARSRTCVSAPVGYSAGVGYDQATGLGSVDGYKLVSGWSGGSSIPVTPKVSMTLLSNLNQLGEGDITFLIATATGADGATPTGSVQFLDGATSLGSATLIGSAGTATATLAVSGSQLPAGSGTITAVYEEVSASVTLKVQSTGSVSNGTPVIGGLTNAASFKQVYAPGMLLSVFGSQLAPSTVQASSVPLPSSMAGVAVTINNVVAPLLYVSPGLLNIQIPYEIPVNSQATLAVNNNGQVASLSFIVGSVAPGIFFDSTTGAPVPNESASRGQIITLYITGAGLLTPAVPTGGAPASGTALSALPVPVGGTTVTVAGVTAMLDFVGDTPGLVGVLQINYTVPTGISTGVQPVAVSVGGVSSATVNLTVTN
ncbi:MAG: protease pro-enzyme activation domain-containing protein [Bryobacteraceae bacterium]